MHYSEAVAQAAAALITAEDAEVILEAATAKRDAARWDLARLTFENTNSGGGIQVQEGRVPMRQWAADVSEASGRSFGYQTGFRYKAIWVRFGNPSPTGEGVERPTWSIAYDMVRSTEPPMAERFADISFQRVARDASIDSRRDMAAELLSDPAVADAIIAQPETRRAVYESLGRQEQRAEAKHNTIRASDPVGQRLDRESALIDLEKLLRTFADQARTLVVAIGALPERSDGAVNPHLFLRQSFVAAEDALGSVRSLLTTGKSDIDNFLADVLNGGQ